jgi:hypothetical protein
LTVTATRSLSPWTVTVTRSTTWRMMALRSVSVVVGAFHNAGTSAASRRIAARSGSVSTRGCWLVERR